MMFEREKEAPLAPVGWLSRARAQSQKLAEARAERAAPVRIGFAESKRRRGAHQPFAFALAGMLLALVASGAWALVAKRAQESSPPPPSPSPSLIAPPPARAPAVDAPAPKVPAPIARPRKVKPVPFAPTPPAPPPPPGPVKFEEGEADLILVAPHEPPRPLFSTDEWKQRR